MSDPRVDLKILWFNDDLYKHLDIMRPRQHLTIDQKVRGHYMALNRCFQREVSTELKEPQSVISRYQRLEELQKSREVDVLWPHLMMMTASF